jgi:hypothetical protein
MRRRLRRAGRVMAGWLLLSGWVLLFLSPLLGAALSRF